MRFTIEPKVLAAELQKFAGVTNSKGPLVIVKNVLITAEDNRLTMQGTDLVVTLTTGVDCQVDEPGHACVNCHDFAGIIKALKGDSVEITLLENHYARIQSGGADCRLVGLPAAEFPALAKPGKGDAVELPSTTLVECIGKVINCVSSDQSRPNLMGAYLTLADERLTMVSTDGHRMAKVERPIVTAKIPKAFVDGILIPVEGLAEVRRAAIAHDGPVKTAINGLNAFFRFGDAVLSVRLMDAQFPDYSKVVPSTNTDRQARVPFAEFTEVLRFCSLFTERNNPVVNMEIDNDTMTMTASSPDKGEARQSLEVEYSGQRQTIGMNFRLVLDALKSIRSDNEGHFLMQPLDSYSPVLFLDEENADDRFIVMPMRV